jgi:flagellar basal body rod protein FlgG
LDTNGQLMRVPVDARSAAISHDGMLSASEVDTGQRLAVVRFSNPGGLVKEGAVTVQATAAAGKANAVEPDLETAALEQSNTSALAGMSSMVEASREFEMLSRVIEAFSQVEQRVAQEVARK